MKTEFPETESLSILESTLTSRTSLEIGESEIICLSFFNSCLMRFNDFFLINTS